jgi:NAD-dependent deacetylase
LSIDLVHVHDAVIDEPTFMASAETCKISNGLWPKRDISWPAGPPGFAGREVAARAAAGEDGPVSDAGWAAGVRTVAVLTGAGISTDSGIPDFRGPNGIWTRDPAAERLSTYQHYMADPALRRRSWQARLAHPAWTARPNAAHLALARLASSAVDTRVITQNIDELQQKAGLPADRVIELHGTMFGVVCIRCGDRTAMAAALERVRAGEDDPACARCGGVLKSATVMFGQALDPGVFARAVAAATGCDLFLAIGSTLSVEPAASLCALAVRSGARLVIVNRDATPYDGLAVATITEPIGAAVPAIVDRLLAEPGAARPG